MLPPPPTHVRGKEACHSIAKHSGLERGTGHCSRPEFQTCLKVPTSSESPGSYLGSSSRAYGATARGRQPRLVMSSFGQNKTGTVGGHVRLRAQRDTCLVARYKTVLILQKPIKFWHLINAA